MTTVFLDTATLHRDDIDFSPFSEFGEVVHYQRSRPEEVVERIADAEIIITNKVVIDADKLAAAPKLKLICAAATGVNHLDLEAIKARGISACNVSGYSTQAVAQHAFANILSLATSLHRYAPEAAQWPDSPLFTRLDHPVFELAGETLGIIGLGTIGREVAKIARALGMDVVALAREGASASGDIPRLPRAEFFAASRVISLHAPLTPETEKIINAESLALCAPGTLLINTGRGPLIDEQAVADALRSGQLGGAGLDVLSTEPPAPDNPLLAPDLPNLLITPHTAWAAREARQRLIDGLLSNIRGFLAGDLPNRVA
ncbi:MAG: D-2-hydroxyacid dehydrogenase [Verrucomicrobiales bacterium]